MIEKDTPILRVTNIRKDFGGLMAVDSVSFEVRTSQIKAIIGPNGSGKTTILNLISGILPASSGEIKFKSNIISKLKSHVIASLGISRTFQIVRLFKDLTVLDNVIVGCQRWSPAGIWDVALRAPQARKAEDSMQKHSMACLNFVGMASKAFDIAGNLPFGEQRLLELARATAAKPELLLLDEPCAGLNDAEREKFIELLLAIREKGIAIILVEHNMDIIMNTADEIMVLNFGKKIAEGIPTQIQQQEEVIAAYLGA